MICSKVLESVRFKSIFLLSFFGYLQDTATNVQRMINQSSVLYLKRNI